MFYQANEAHGLAHDPFKAIIAPRPIGWISTLDRLGRPNLAPYSFFNAVGDSPKILMFSSGGMKDTAQNVADTGEFTFNFVSSPVKEAMNVSSMAFPAGENEFEKAGLTPEAGQTVSCPRVKGVAAAMECRLLEIITPTALDGSPSKYSMVLGQVTGIFIDDSMVTPEGRFDTMKADPVLRAGYHDYVTINQLFEMVRPS